MIVSHVGNVTVNGGSGPDISVTQQVYYAKTPPTTTRTVSGSTLTVTYDCPAQATGRAELTDGDRAGLGVLAARFPLLG